MARSELKFKKDLNTSSIWILLIGLAAVTTYFNTNFEDPFNTPKLVLLLVTAGWLSGHVIQHYLKQKIKKKSVEFWILIASLGFILFQIIALLNTDIFIIGFIGDTQRRNGFLGYLALTIIFLFTSIRFNYFYSLRFIKTSIFIGLTLSLYGFLQTEGRDFVQWDNPYNSMISTLGNPNFASALLAVLTIISTLLLFIKSIQNTYKLVALLVVVLSLIAIIKSNSRQGLLVITLGLLFYLLIYSYFHFHRARVFIILATAGIFSLLIAGMLQIGPLERYLYKSSVSVRGYYWKAAYEMFKSEPLTGVGLDRYGSYFKEFREVGYPLNYGFEITSSNAHNVYLQLLSTGGLFVGVFYALILLLVFINGIKNVKYSSGDEQKIALLLLSAWIGFQSQSLISIDNVGLSVWGWILSGSILGIRVNSQKSEPPINKTTKFKNNIKPINLFVPLASSLILIPILFISINLWTAESNMFLVRQYANSETQEKNQLVYSYSQKLISNKWTDPNYKFRASLYLVDVGFLAQSYKQISALNEVDPRNLDLLEWLADYHKSIADYKTEIMLRDEISLYDQWNANNYLMLGIAYKQIGDIANSKNMLQKINSFAPNSDAATKAKLEF